jgi:hypothetical protein
MARKHFVWLIGFVLAVAVGQPGRAKALQAVMKQPPQKARPESSPSGGRLMEQAKPAGSVQPRPGTVAIDPNVTRGLHSLVGSKITPELRLRMPKLMQQLDWGRVTFSPPNVMRCNEEKTVNAVFSRSASPDQLRAHLAKLAGVDANEIAVPTAVQAELRGGEALDIRALTPTTEFGQLAGEGHNASWDWIVRPTRAGQYELHLTVFCLVTVGDEPYRCDIATPMARIDVTPLGAWKRVVAFVSGNWQWLWAAVLVPLAGVLWKLSRKKKATPSDNVPDSRE